MIFNDLAFIFIFLPIALIGFFLGSQVAREWFLIGMSLIFYGIAGPEHVIVLLATIAWVWVFTYSDAAVRSKWRFVAAITGPLLALFYYKYLGFVVREVLPLSALQGWRADVADKLLPAGISFFTFHLVSFACDRHRGDVARQPAFPHFVLYIAFFPHLVAGPILRYHEVRDALHGLTRFRPTEDDLRKAILYFVIGLALKVLLADSLSAYINPLTHAAASLTPIQSSYVLFGYSFQIYFDFWGYSLMATGLAHLFGFRFPLNFDRPYNSANPRDFWRRWHMTLSRWFRDYVYIPMGGNRSYIRNILIVFMICGFWHGAAWQFMVWGAYHGLLIVTYHLTQRKWDRLPLLAQRAVTFVLVSLGWTLFLFDFHTAWQFMHGLVGLSPVDGGVAAIGVGAWVMLGLAAFVCFFIDVERLIRMDGIPRPAVLGASLGFAALVTLSILFIDRSESFIYFRF